MAFKLKSARKFSLTVAPGEEEDTLVLTTSSGEKHVFEKAITVSVSDTSVDIKSN